MLFGHVCLMAEITAVVTRAAGEEERGWQRCHQEKGLGGVENRVEVAGARWLLQSPW